MRRVSCVSLVVRKRGFVISSGGVSFVIRVQPFIFGAQSLFSLWCVIIVSLVTGIRRWCVVSVLFVIRKQGFICGA